MESKRLEPEFIRSLYEKTGWVPAENEMGNVTYGWGCPSAVMLVDMGLDPEEEVKRLDSKQIDDKITKQYGISKLYLLGFECGFADNHPWCAFVDFLNGYDDGIESRSFVDDMTTRTPQWAQERSGEEKQDSDAEEPSVPW